MKANKLAIEKGIINSDIKVTSQPIEADLLKIT